MVFVHRAVLKTGHWILGSVFGRIWILVSLNDNTRLRWILSVHKHLSQKNLKMREGIGYC